MGRDEVHPGDVDRLERLGEALFDLSAGRATAREPVVAMVKSLMPLLRDDLSFSNEGAENIVDRLFVIADHYWLSARDIADLSVAIIRGPTTAFPDIAPARFPRRRSS